MLIIAVDFDGILCENQFPEIGPPNYAMVSFVRELIDRGHRVILWTSRVENELMEAIDWCRDRGLVFTTINQVDPDNLKEYGTDPRKVYADIYIDDHNPNFVVLKRVFSNDVAIDTTIEHIRRILEWKEEN